MITALALVGGLVLLGLGAEGLVRGSSRLAAALKISPLVIGLTVVAFGTSAPEMSVSVLAAIDGKSDIALGNVLGSNIFNILFILGLAALAAPLVVAQKLVRIDVPLMIALTGLMWWFAADGEVSRREGWILFAGYLSYMILAVVSTKHESKGVAVEYEHDVERRSGGPSGSRVVDLVLIVVGLGLLVAGSRVFVGAAIELAKSLGVSDLVIALTVVAAGTSLPELATSVLAALRGERDIAVGNVVGSNMFNILGVLGLSAVCAPSGIPVAAQALRFDFPVNMAAAVACLPIFIAGYRVTRWRGALLFGYGVAYVAYLVLDAQGYEGLPTFSWVMAFFILPLTGSALLALCIVAWRGRGSAMAAGEDAKDDAQGS